MHSFIFYCQQISSQQLCLCEQTLHVSLCPQQTWHRRNPSAGAPSGLESLDLFYFFFFFLSREFALPSNTHGVHAVSCSSGFQPLPSATPAHTLPSSLLEHGPVLLAAPEGVYALP